MKETVISSNDLEQADSSMFCCIVTFTCRGRVVSIIRGSDQSDGSWGWWWLCSPHCSSVLWDPPVLIPRPLRPYCDLRPDKGRWKRDCQTGRARLEPLWEFRTILSWRGQWKAFSHTKKGCESVWAALLSAPLPISWDSRRHSVTAVSGMLCVRDSQALTWDWKDPFTLFQGFVVFCDYFDAWFSENLDPECQQLFSSPRLYCIWAVLLRIS